MGIRRFSMVLAALAVAGCVQTVSMPSSGPPQPGFEVAAAPILSPAEAAENFVTVIDRVKPVAETYCRRLSRVANCDFQIVIDDRPGQPANAFQTVDRSGRPILAFTVPLIRDARNRDELAFVLGHEAAHHIAGHLPRQQSKAMAGAVLAGILVQASGGGQEAVASAQDIGAFVGARQYSKEFELEADRLGAEIAYMAGFDPRVGAAFFDRIPDPGDQFLGTHPANSDRKRVVAETVARLGG
ncbi:M48 family metalloprotease [Tabrizicola sp.]|uniref:M48 family metalloprotease n=1 Tax=Tabrizicola sp. TaxID=2005166 RepID=UPI003D28B879